MSHPASCYGVLPAHGTRFKAIFSGSKVELDMVRVMHCYPSYTDKDPKLL